MRVLLAHALYLPDFEGGGEYIVHEIAKGLAERGVEVRVITSGDPKLDNLDGIPITRLPISKYRFNLAIPAIYEAAKDADVIQTFNYHACAPAWIAGRMAGKSIVCEMLGLFGPQWRAMRGPVVGRAFEVWERLLLRIPYDAVGFLSDYSRDMRCAASVPRSRSFICLPGISPEHFRAEPKDDVVLFVGKLETRKGIDLVVESARRLPHVRFRAIGWGENEDELRRAAPPNLTFDGFVTGEKLYSAFARARIFLFPSRAETFGLVVAEAMASGCAIVSSAPVGFSGVRIDPDDLTTIASALERLWSDRAETERMGAENLRLAKAFSWERHIDTLLDVYERLIAARGRGVGGNEAAGTS